MIAMVEERRRRRRRRRRAKFLTAVPCFWRNDRS
jgi:hypothetical protein